MNKVGEIERRFLRIFLTQSSYPAWAGLSAAPLTSGNLAPLVGGRDLRDPLSAGSQAAVSTS